MPAKKKPSKAKPAPKSTKTTPARAKKQQNQSNSTYTLLKLLSTFVILLLCGLVYLDAWLLERFEGRKWSIPASVYARPLELYQGRAIQATDVIKELRAA